jgi:hypothetical protein
MGYQMRRSEAKLASALAESVCVDDDTLAVQLSQSRAIATPLECFPHLRGATGEQRGNWRLNGNGVGTHRPDLDEDISV